MAHREVWIVPTPKNTEAFEIALVLLNIARGKFAAEAAKFRRWNLSFAAKLFFDLRFDGETMAIPPRHVRGVMARHGFRFDDEVFQDFIETGTEMDGARRIRRAIVQNKKWFALSSCKNGIVKIRFLPGIELFWLILRETGFHRKVSFGEI